MAFEERWQLEQQDGCMQSKMAVCGASWRHKEQDGGMWSKMEACRAKWRRAEQDTESGARLRHAQRNSGTFVWVMVRVKVATGPAA